MPSTIPSRLRTDGGGRQSGDGEYTTRMLAPRPILEMIVGIEEPAGRIHEFARLPVIRNAKTTHPRREVVEERALDGIVGISRLCQERWRHRDQADPLRVSPAGEIAQLRPTPSRDFCR